MPEGEPPDGMTGAGEMAESAEVEIEGMSCGACVSAVEQALARLPAGSVVRSHVEVGLAKLEFRPDLVNVAAVIEAIEDCGFDARLRQPTSAEVPLAPVKEDGPTLAPKAAENGPRRVMLSVPGMVCSSCVGWVTGAIEKAVGSQSVTSISLQRKTVEVLLSGGLAGVLQILEEIGFPARLLDAPPQTRAGALGAAGAAATSKTAAGDGASAFGRPQRAPPADTSLLRIRGMSCAACAATVERTARRIPGVADAAVSVLGHSALLTWAPGCPPNPEAVAAAVRASGYPTEVVRSGADAASQVSFLVSGIVCAGCPARIVLAVQSVKGVGAVSADELTGKVTIEFDPEITGGPRTLLDKLTRLGYGAELYPEPSAADVDGELAVSEAREWRNLFLWSLVFTVPVVLIGMVLARVPETEHGLMFELLPHAEPGQSLMAATPLAAPPGGGAAPPPPLDHMAHGAHNVNGTLSSAPTSTPVSVGFPAAMMMTHDQAHSRSLPLMSVVTWALATPVQFGCGLRFFRGAYRAVRAGVANMDVLVVVGTFAAYAYSALVVLLRALLHSASAGAVGDPMFDTPAMLISFVLLGKWLESAAKGRTHFALRALSALQPDAAVIVSADLSSEREVPAALLQLGDLVKVEPGHRVAVDGLVVSGSVAIDESMLTGESVLVLKEPGSRVVAGSTPREGSAVVRATAVGASTGIARIVDLVRTAQASKPPIQAAADAVSAVFVPAIVAFAVITFAAWFGAAEGGAVPDSWMAAEGPFLFSFLFAIATVVIACPCALGLAVPTVVMVSTGLGAANGILFKGGGPLQSAAKVSAVAFDKTGTLTVGAPSVEVLELLPGSEAVLPGGPVHAAAVAAALEADSPHPIAKAIVAHAGRAGEVVLPDVAHRSTVLGRGIAGVVGDTAVMVGSPAWAQECGAEVSADIRERILQLEESGHTVLVLCCAPAPLELLVDLFESGDGVGRFGGGVGAASAASAHGQGKTGAKRRTTATSVAEGSYRGGVGGGGGASASISLAGAGAGPSSRGGGTERRTTAGSFTDSAAGGWGASGSSPLAPISREPSLCGAGSCTLSAKGKEPEDSSARRFSSGSVLSAGWTPRPRRRTEGAPSAPEGMFGDFSDGDGDSDETAEAVAAALSRYSIDWPSGLPDGSGGGGAGGAACERMFRQTSDSLLGGVALAHLATTAEEGAAQSPSLSSPPQPQQQPAVPAAAAAAARGGACAILALRDGVKPDARDAISALRRMGVLCVMLTGDNPRAAAAVAAAVGIDDVRAGLLPDEKLANLRMLKATGRVVAMVGDGVNDAPALAEADVGVAIGAGAEVAVETAGVVLVHSRVKDVPATIQLAAAAMRRIRLNLFFSLVFNTLGVPLAAGVFFPAFRWRLPPEAAAAAMSVSSVFVVLSSLELKRFRSPYFAREEDKPAAAAPTAAPTAEPTSAAALALVGPPPPQKGV